MVDSARQVHLQGEDEFFAGLQETPKVLFLYFFY